MSDFYRVQIDDKYLTSSALVGGEPCRLEVTNVGDLQTTLTGNAYPVSSGKTKVQMVEWIEGKEFEVRVFAMLADHYEDFREKAEECKQKLMVNENDPDAPIIISGTGEPGDFEVSAIWNPVNPYSFARFIDEFIYEVVFRFITKGVIE